MDSCCFVQENNWTNYFFVICKTRQLQQITLCWREPRSGRELELHKTEEPT